MNFVRLTREQQMDVINRTFHGGRRHELQTTSRSADAARGEQPVRAARRISASDVPETDVRTALATGDMGFLHSFTTGSAVDGPGVRVVAWTAGCMWRCLYCHNPDTWTMRNGIPVTHRAGPPRNCASTGTA